MADPTLTIGQLVEQYQAGVLARDAEAMVRLVESYGRVYTQLAAQADALIADVEKLIAQGQKPSQAQIRRLARYQSLMEQTERQLGRYGAVVEDEVRGAQLDAARLANQAVPELVQGTLEGMTPALQSGIMGAFQVLPDDAIMALVGALQEGSPLAELFERYGSEAAKELGDILVRGLASGIGARKVADEMRRVLGIPLSDALRISRTEIMRSFRAATLADYRANAHIVKGWIWHSALDRRTCMGCIAMHGTEHPLSETLDDHPNGRCAAVPITVSPRDIGIDIDWERGPVETGEAWFERQPESVQREMMGPGKYEAWKDGKFQLRDLVGQQTDPRWGTMRYERSLKDLVND